MEIIKYINIFYKYLLYILFIKTKMATGNDNVSVSLPSAVGQRYF